MTSVLHSFIADYIKQSWSYTEIVNIKNKNDIGNICLGNIRQNKTLIFAGE